MAVRDPRIDAYIAKANPFAEPILAHVRDRVHATVPNAVETLKWSAPAFTVDGKILLIMAAFKAHAALNFWRGQELRGSEADDGAMGQFGKLTSIADLPPDTELDALIAEAAALARTAPAPRKVKHEPKPAAELHPDFAAALDVNPAAKTTLDGFSPSARREYLDWVSDAKQDATRTKRIATAVEWLAEGKKRNWKYEKCQKCRHPGLEPGSAFILRRRAKKGGSRVKPGMTTISASSHISPGRPRSP